MRVPDQNLNEIRERGFTIVKNFLDPATLKAAQDALWTVFPRPEDYFADPAKYADFAKSQFAGLRNFPYRDWAFNAVAAYPDLADAARRFLKSDDIEIYKVELWAKYAGAVNYDQPHHRDFGNHTLVVPRADGVHTQMTTILLLSDVTALDGPTKVVPLAETRNEPLWPTLLKMGDYFDKEVSVEAPAGSLFIYKTDVFHRGSNFGAPGHSRFVMLIDFQQRGWRWNGKMSWPHQAGDSSMIDALTRMTPAQRDLFGFPPPGSDYWNAQTLRDVQTRYPQMDMTPYATQAARS